jgi:hypothetical protein
MARDEGSDYNAKIIKEFRANQVFMLTRQD